jgi:glutamyl-tRNA synthetase
VSDEFYVPGDDLAALEQGATFRLMDLYNVELVETGAAPRAKYAGEELIQGSRKLQWVAADNRRVRVVEPGVLFDEAGNFDASSLKEVEGLAEAAFSDLKEGEIVQFPRFGFCRLDSPGTAILAHK